MTHLQTAQAPAQLRVDQRVNTPLLCALSISPQGPAPTPKYQPPYKGMEGTLLAQRRRDVATPHSTPLIWRPLLHLCELNCNNLCRGRAGRSTPGAVVHESNFTAGHLHCGSPFEETSKKATRRVALQFRTAVAYLHSRFVYVLHSKTVPFKCVLTAKYLFKRGSLLQFVFNVIIAIIFHFQMLRYFYLIMLCYSKSQHVLLKVIKNQIELQIVHKPFLYYKMYRDIHYTTVIRVEYFTQRTKMTNKK